MEEAIIYQLPDEIFDHIFTYVRFEDFFALFLTCRKIYRSSHKPEVWRFWIERDFYKDYERYLDKINAKNEIIMNAIEIRPQINPLFVLINKALAELKVHTDKLTEIIDNISDRDTYDLFMPDSVESIDGELDSFQDNLTNYCNDTAGNDLIVDLFKTDPIALYIQLATANDIKPCKNMIDQPRTRVKRLCGQLSMPRKDYCQKCMDTNKNLIMKPTVLHSLGFPFGLPSLQPKTSIDPIPQLPVYVPNKIQIKSFSPGKYVTINTEPHFVIERINTGGYCLVGVNDIGVEIRPATYPEKETAHGLGISISF